VRYLIYILTQVAEHYNPTMPELSELSHQAQSVTVLRVPGGKDRCVFTVSKLLSRSECASFIDAASKHGCLAGDDHVEVRNQNLKFVPADSTNRGQSEVRRVKHFQIHCRTTAAALWEQLRHLLPDITKDGILYEPVCVDECLRFLLYLEGHHHTSHVDGERTNQSENTISLMTLLIYLNDVDEGCGG
jgi:hypothetical protein